MIAKTNLRSGLLSVHAALARRRPEDAIVLSCDPRSGSTWLSEILGQSLNAVTIWEPFHLDEVPEMRRLGLGWREFIPADAEWPEAETLVRKVLSGRLINPWISSANPAKAFFTADRLLVKCCRANGFLPWMVRRIEFKARPIHFLRHPFAIVASQLKMGNFDGSGLRDALFEGRYADQLSHQADYILGLQSDEERIVAMWCRTHLPCLTDPERNRYWITTHYEELLREPEAEITRIFSQWDRPVPTNILDSIRRPSRMTQQGALKADAMAQITKWQTHFPDSKQRAMAAVLTHFEVACYNHDPFPVA
jgi:hypothetical protein